MEVKFSDELIVLLDLEEGFKDKVKLCPSVL